jgi:hypothetical protein
MYSLAPAAAAYASATILGRADILGACGHQNVSHRCHIFKTVLLISRLIPRDVKVDHGESTIARRVACAFPRNAQCTLGLFDACKYYHQLGSSGMQ